MVEVSWTPRDSTESLLHEFEAPPGAWTEVEFRPDRFQDNARQGKRMQDGDLIGYVALYAGEPARDLRLDLDWIIVDLPRPARRRCRARAGTCCSRRA